MAVLKFMLANLKKRKSYSAVICVLVFLTGLILSVTISTAQTANRAYDSAFNKMEGPHLFYWMGKGSFTEEYVNWFKKQDAVKSVVIRETNSFNGAVFKNRGAILKDGVNNILFEYNDDCRMRLIDSTHSPSEKLSKGEIYMPHVYKTMHGVDTGDIVYYEFGGHKMSFRVAGFLEDPVYGQDMAGSKFFFVSREDLLKFQAVAGKDCGKAVQMLVHLKKLDESLIYKLRKDFLKEFSSYDGNVMTYMQLKNDHLTLPRVALVVVVAFAFILCIITVTILRYAILATIEADYLNIGIIKALGFTPLMVQAAVTSQYGVLALVSGVLSLVAGILATPYMGDAVLKSSGLFFNGGLSILTGIIILTALVIVISVFSYITAGRTRKISPVRAIANGVAPVYFSSRLALKLETIRFLPFDIRMALKQVATKSKRYILLVVISLLLAYAMVFFMGLVQLFGSERSIGLVGGEISDIEIDTNTKAEVDKILKKVRKDYAFDWITYQVDRNLSIDDEKTNVRIQENFYASGNLRNLEGRHPKHDNEVALSVVLRDKYKKGVGDYVTIRDFEGKPHRFIVTGIFQTIDNGGEYARLQESGMKALDPGFELNEAYIRLKNHNDVDTVVSEMRKRYSGYEEISNNRTEAEEKLAAVKSVFSSISKLVFILTIILIGFITLLIMKITLYSETREMGIFKAVGFSSAKIRFQLALRFALVTVLGGILGVASEALTGSLLFSLALRGIGIASLKIPFGFFNTIIPVVMITFIAMLSAYASSGNTKRVSAYVLINE